MPRIDIRGKAPGGGAGDGLGAGGGRDTSSIAGIDTSNINLNRIGLSGQDRAKTELRLRQMVRSYDQYLVQEAAKAESSLLATAERGAVAKTAIDKRQSQQERQRKQQSDREYLNNYKKLLADQEREKHKSDQREEKVRRDTARQMDREVREQARQQAREQRVEATRAASEARHSAHIRRENVRAFGFGAIAGGALGGAAAGDLGGVLGAVGGGLGGGIGSIIGNAIAPGLGGIVGKAIGSAIGSLAGVAVNPYRAAYAASKPYLDYTESTAALARRGVGPSGDGLDRMLFDHGRRIPPEWMQQIGMGPTSAAAALGGLGYAPQGNVRQTLTTISNLTNRSSAFAGLGQDAVTGLLGRGGAYGINAPTETGAGRMAGVAELLQEAVARGLDHSRILDSVEGSLDSLVTNSGRADIEGITKMTQQLMFGGTAGGLTGSTAKDIISAGRATGDNVIQNGLTSAGLTMLVSKEYGGLKTAGDVARFAGVKSPDDIDPQMMKDILSAANSGRLNTAVRLASTEAVQGAHFAQLAPEAFKYAGLPEDTKSIYLSNFLGSNLAAGQGYNSSLSMKGMSALDAGIMHYNGNNPGYAASVENIYQRNFGTSATGGFDKKIGKAGYLKELIAKGVDPEVALDIVNSAEKRGLNPRLLASVGMQESHLNKKQGRGALNSNGTYDSGIMQINNNTDNLKKYPGAFTSLAGNIDAGADLLTNKIKGVGGFGDQGGNNVALAAMRDKSINDQGNLNEAFLSLKTLEPTARMFAGSVDKFQKAVEDFVHGRTQWTQPVPTHGTRAPTTLDVLKGAFHGATQAGRAATMFIIPP